MRALHAIVGACGWLVLVSPGCKSKTDGSQSPDVELPTGVHGVEDPQAMCRVGCRRLAACVPELAEPVDGDPWALEGRLREDCEAACDAFDDIESATSLGDCVALTDCASFHACATSESVTPWLSVVAPAIDRSCGALCGRASSCIVDDPRRPTDDDDATPDVTDLEEACLWRCRSTPKDSRRRNELVACNDHPSCGAVLECLDGWSQTAYDEGRISLPGTSQTCDGFCTRAIECAAEAEEVALDEEALGAMKLEMAETWVECAVQCEKRRNGEGSRALDECTGTSDCEEYFRCAEKL